MLLFHLLQLLQFLFHQLLLSIRTVYLLQEQLPESHMLRFYLTFSCFPPLPFYVLREYIYSLIAFIIDYFLLWGNFFPFISIFFHKRSLLFTTFSVTRFAMHRIYADRINSRDMSRVFCDFHSQKTPRGILPVNSNQALFSCFPVLRNLPALIPDTA